ncbi:MBL fold metallo-hydrolase [Actinomycetospora sp. NBRC 106378]|uniref:MBL fold metallo-hydrolase n=1 Tax=Actinomycetospora sp. NBRC 106378 TaxID=3032208 RepID=UPI0024A2A982|nr:MBL fold metallo-hydrolase [Actinomycetospora sp. NBRC 106378]GLZ55551.1 MBL fold metallo-hydrolase [Actinomycetospora sp. NBRC 106378]
MPPPPLHVHVHVSPPIPTAVTDLPPDLDVRVWSPIATTLIGGEREAVLVDPPLTVEQADSVVERVHAWGRELTTIYVTHAHGDHWFGAAALLERFPAARVVALPEVAARARAQSPEDVTAFWEVRFPGGQIPVHRVAPEPMTGRTLELEGHELVAVPLGHTDTDDTSCLHVPSLDLVVAGDAVYDDVHLYLAESPAVGRAAWRDALDVVRDLAPRTVIAGHQRPGSTGDPAAIEATRAYLDDFEELLTTASDPLALYRAMRGRHPDRVNPGALWGSVRAALPAGSPA